MPITNIAFVCSLPKALPELNPRISRCQLGKHVLGKFAEGMDGQLHILIPGIMQCCYSYDLHERVV